MFAMILPSLVLVRHLPTPALFLTASAAMVCLSAPHLTSVHCPGRYYRSRSVHPASLSLCFCLPLCCCQSGTNLPSFHCLTSSHHAHGLRAPKKSQE